jgi:hypothetical protein
MKTLRLIGLGNDEFNKRSSFILEQSELFQESFNEILEKIKINDQIYDEQLPIKSRVNEIDHFKNKDYDIDVVYTIDTIILIVRAEQKNLERFKSLILACSKMEE